MKKDIKTYLRISGCVFLLYLCIYYWDRAAAFISALFGAAAPIFVGCITAYIVNILMSFYEKHFFVKSGKAFAVKCRRPVCMIAAYATIAAIAAIVIVLIVPQLASCVRLITASLPAFIKSAAERLEKLGIVPQDISEMIASVDWRSKISQLADILQSGVGSAANVIASAVTAVFSGVVSLFLGIIFSFYMLLGKERLSRQMTSLMKRFVKAPLYDKIMHTAAVLDECFHRYIVGQCTEAVILGVLCTLGMLALRLPYAAMIGAFISFTALIPVAGAYIGAIVGAFMILTVSPLKAVIFVVFIIVLQQLEGNLIYPRVVGSSIGLPALWVLAAVTVGGSMMGIFGMMLAVPLAAAMYKLLKESIKERN